ncbi:MAG: hypothetical protein ACXWXR_04850, partial [Candidatus Limnocylindrales bacterium]
NTTGSSKREHQMDPGSHGGHQTLGDPAEGRARHLLAGLHDGVGRPEGHLQLWCSILVRRPVEGGDRDGTSI